MKNIAIITAIATSITACGGGGDSGPGAVTETGQAVALTSSNYEVAGKEVMGGTSNAGNISDFSGLLSGAEISKPVSFPQFVLKKYPQVLQSAKQPAILSGVTLTETLACTSGGSLTLSGDLSNEDSATPGDSITLSASNCKEDGTVFNGSMSLRVVSISGVPDIYPYTLVLEASTSGLSATSGLASFQSSGSFTMRILESSFNSSDVSVTIPSLTATATSSGKSETYKYVNYKLDTSIRGSTISMTMNGGLNVPSLGSNLVNVQTQQAFVSTTSYPTAGSATATTATGGRMRISAAPASKALIELDANNDGTYEASKVVSWAEVF